VHRIIGGTKQSLGDPEVVAWGVQDSTDTEDVNDCSVLCASEYGRSALEGS
jgi:hypothetical protein